MTKQLLLAAMFVIVPVSVRAQTQKTTVPVAREIKTGTGSVKTHQKKKLSHPTAAERGLVPSELVSVVAPNGETRVVRRKKAPK